QRGLRAAGGGPGPGPRLLRRPAPGVRRRRAAVQRVDPARLLPPLRADRRFPARALLPVPGGLGGPPRGGGALAAVRGVDDGGVARPGGGGGGGVGRLARAARPSPAGGGGAGPAAAGAGRGDVPAEQRAAHGLPALPAAGVAGDEQLGGVGGGGVQRAREGL